MITPDELALIEITLEQPVADFQELAQRAVTLHDHCSLLLAEVKRQRSLLALGVRVVGAPVAAAGSDASRAAEHDASVPAGERVPTVGEIAQAMVDAIAWHGSLCQYRRGSGACSCYIGPTARVTAAERVHQLLERGQS